MSTRIRSAWTSEGPPAETYYEEQLNTIQTDLAVESYDGYLIAPL